MGNTQNVEGLPDNRILPESRSGFEWHDNAELNNAARRFHDKYARQPSRLEEARQMHHKFMTEIEGYLRNKGICLRIEYTGSAYEGVKVSKSETDDDLEFDVMIIMKDGRKLVAEDDQSLPGYAQLKPRSQDDQSLAGILSSTRIFTYNRCVDAVKTLDMFFGVLQKCVNQSEQLNGKVKLRRHGPAAQMDVHPDSGMMLSGPKFYSVDIVPAFDINGQIYVAKPLKGETMPHNCWRKSFSVEEKQKFDAADRGNGCRKQVYRILKVIRNREPGLASLTSYHLKTALFQEMDCEQLFWTSEDVGARLMGVFGQLEVALENQRMSHYYLPGVNLLQGLSPEAIKNMKFRIERLRRSQTELMKILNR